MTVLGVPCGGRQALVCRRVRMEQRLERVLGESSSGVGLPSSMIDAERLEEVLLESSASPSRDRGLKRADSNDITVAGP